MANIDDKPVTAVVVSFLPIDYNPYFPGMLPSFYHIPAAERDDFNVVPIKDGKSDIYIGDGRTIPSHTSGIEIAGAIARDYIVASMYTTPNGFPGLKSIPGDHSKERIKDVFGDELEALNTAQKYWFENLVKVADDIWMDPNAKGKQQSISELMRVACKRLGLNREWITAITVDNVECFACGYNVKSSALICINCKTILKPEEYAAKSLLKQPIQEAVK